MGRADLLPMAGMGLITAVLAPSLLLLTRHHRVWRPLSYPASIALPFFVLLHGTITIGSDLVMPDTAERIGLAVLLLTGAIVFWLPVLGTARRLDDFGRCVYLYLGAPSLDLAGVIIVARGDSGGGLAMIVAMLPIGLAAVILTWRALHTEETAEQARTVTEGSLRNG